MEDFHTQGALLPATSARSEVLKQGVYLSLFSTSDRPLTKLTGKTTLKKARDDGFSWGRAEKGGEWIWSGHLENNQPGHCNCISTITEQIPPTSPKHYILIVCHPRHFF